MANNYPNIKSSSIKRQVPVFLLVGTFSVLIDFFSYHWLLWTQFLSIDYAKATSFLIGTVFAYFANRFWTFGHNVYSTTSIWRFTFLYSFTLSVNVAVNFLVLNVLGENAISLNIAYLVATGISAMLNFFGMKLFVFYHHTAIDKL